MAEINYNLVALLAVITPVFITLKESKEKRSLLGFLIFYGISFLITLFIFLIFKSI